MKHLFFGGVHPADRKELTGRGIPAPAPIPAQVVIPLRQHIGAPCTPLVKPGDTVGLGQKLGDGEGLCVPVHASVSGLVTAVEPRPHPGGGQVLSVVIENDYQDTPASALEPHLDLSGLTKEEIVSIIGEAGIVGMGGATFPTDVKTVAGMGRVDTLIANACECEPYITADDALLCTYPEQVLRGMGALMAVLEPKRAVLAVEDNKSEAVGILKKQMETFPGIELLILPTRYPQGAEKQLIQAVTGRQVPPGALPKDVGCAVFNAATFASIYKAVYEGEPVTRRIVTVTGEGVREPKNLIVRIGTPFSEVIAAAGGLTGDVWKVLSGGPMMGVAQADLAVPVVKGTNAVLCLSRAQDREGAHPQCIRCAKCVTACPMSLQPLYLYRFEQAGDLTALRRLNLTDCIECGCCAYVCPGRLPLVESFRAGKRAVKEENAS
ncbi:MULTISPECIES: electron transport complex subunit RsxC [Intestinimonas]|uniref:electron transport complex subunit RsxC n=1 Tax=Intestinimonas TaxID=1392389 RepID=UPI00067F2D56|nr:MULTISPECIES: electron transport complex subunit RsxC [Intestinimonas]MBS6282849.1 electron transport complex subunit RsxC [Oscillospiraceae bacterium]